MAWEMTTIGNAPCTRCLNQITIDYVSISDQNSTFFIAYSMFLNRTFHFGFILSSYWVHFTSIFHSLRLPRNRTIQNSPKSEFLTSNQKRPLLLIQRLFSVSSRKKMLKVKFAQEFERKLGKTVFVFFFRAKSCEHLLQQTRFYANYSRNCCIKVEFAHFFANYARWWTLIFCILLVCFRFLRQNYANFPSKSRSETFVWKRFRKPKYKWIGPFGTD